MGRPKAVFCKRGHSSVEFRRYTENNSACTECERLRHAAKYKNNKNEILARTRARQMAQRRAAGIQPRRKGRNMELRQAARRKSAKTWRERHPGESNAYARLRQTRRVQRTPMWANLEKIKIIYRVAQQMQRELGIRMAVDHVIPLKGEAVSGLHVHENLQIVPYDINARKSNSYQCA